MQGVGPRRFRGAAIISVALNKSVAVIGPRRFRGAVIISVAMNLTGNIRLLSDDSNVRPVIGPPVDEVAEGRNL